MISSDEDDDDDDDDDDAVVFAADSSGIAYPLYIIMVCMWVSKWVCSLLILSGHLVPASLAYIGQHFPMCQR